MSVNCEALQMPALPIINDSLDHTYKLPLVIVDVDFV